MVQDGSRVVREASWWKNTLNFQGQVLLAKQSMQKWVLDLLWVGPNEIMGTGVWKTHATAPQTPKLSFVIAQL